MTPARDLSVTIGGITVRIGDLQGFTDKHVILRNGMKIAASDFDLNKVRALSMVGSKPLSYNCNTNTL